MAIAHPRKQLAEYLAEHCPKTWLIVPEQRTFDAVGKTTLVVKQQRITRTSAAPIGIRTVEFTLTLVSRFKNIAAAEDDLDARLDELLQVLDAAGGIKWTTADKVAVTETYLGYDVEVEINTTKENL